MILFNIFKIRKLYKEMKENPGKVASEELNQILIGTVITPTVVVGAVIILLFILGFTGFIFKSFVLAKILFYIFFPIYVVILFFVRNILKKIKNLTKSSTNTIVDKTES